MLQQALDSVRVVGNHAVHPGKIDLDDNPETAQKLFVFVNLIVENRISQPAQIKKYYTEVVPQELREAIDKRDGRSS
ncbi:MAG: hypothetical protein IPG69_16960 [Flavobacteriales bacterium]|jgi:hypothetical protein|nr:hypothetical protein [Flavobacteriales bacterium]